MTIQMEYVTPLGRGRYKVRMTVKPNLVEFVEGRKRNLTRVIIEPDEREAKARLIQTIAEFEGILADARRAHMGSQLVWRTIRPPHQLEFRDLDPATAQAVCSLVLGKYPELRSALMQRGILGSQRVQQRADTPLPPRNRIAPSDPVSFESIIDFWNSEKKPGAPSLGIFRSKMAEFGLWLGHTDMERVTRNDLTRYKEHLLKTKRTQSTVKNHLLVIKTIFNFAFKNGKIIENPAPLVPFKAKRNPHDKRQKFSPADRTLILTECRKSGPLIRWSNWISYFSGCRLSEITEIRKEAVSLVDGRYVITTGVKSEGSINRSWPLHSAILREGFLDYWNSRPDGSLLFPRATRTENRSRILNDWLRDIGIIDKRKVFHCHRHTFKTLCREASVEEEVHDSITGHANGSAGRDYGDYPIAVLAEAIERIPDPTVRHSDQMVA